MQITTVVFFIFAGRPEPVLEAAFQLVYAAAQHIDMYSQHGQHPRIGATDVLHQYRSVASACKNVHPLQPGLGSALAKSLIPVYLYEALAINPERRDLPRLRRGEFEGLCKAIATDPSGKPDYGPARLGSAGATIVGARNPLIAYNVYLNSSDLKIAKAIARAIRGSSGAYVACAP